MKKNKKGFTLIELLVVISIISLLSSVVMAGMTAAGNKAKQNAFRSEIMQFVNALEMYKNDNNGLYPTPAGIGGYFYVAKNNNINPDEIGGVFLAGAMSRYLKALPNARGGNSGEAWYYATNSSLNGISWRCSGGVGVPGYVIMVVDTYWGSNFGDWPTAEYSEDNFTTPSVPVDYLRCFSLK